MLEIQAMKMCSNDHIQICFIFDWTNKIVTIILIINVLTNILGISFPMALLIENKTIFSNNKIYHILLAYAYVYTWFAT